MTPITKTTRRAKEIKKSNGGKITSARKRDNCPQCEGTGMVIDFAAIRARNTGGIKLVKYILPSYWATYLINNDVSGISDDDKRAADKFVADHKLKPALSCSDESWFAGHNDAKTLPGDVLEYAFPE